MYLYATHNSDSKTLLQVIIFNRNISLFAKIFISTEITRGTLNHEPSQVSTLKLFSTAKVRAFMCSSAKSIQWSYLVVNFEVARCQQQILTNLVQ